jgi:hypothetical protein
MDLFPAEPEDIFDIAAVFWIVEHVAHGYWPPFAATSRRDLVRIQGISDDLKRGTLLPHGEDAPHGFGPEAEACSGLLVRADANAPRGSPTQGRNCYRGRNEPLEVEQRRL